MIKFFKDSLRELKHVVWPTAEETNKYFISILAVIVGFGLYLFLFSSLFSKILFAVKDLIAR